MMSIALTLDDPKKGILFELSWFRLRLLAILDGWHVLIRHVRSSFMVGHSGHVICSATEVDKFSILWKTDHTQNPSHDVEWFANSNN